MLRVEHLGRSTAQYPGTSYHVSVTRHSDDKVLDWDDLEWKDADWTSPTSAMAQSSVVAGLWTGQFEMPDDFTGAATISVIRSPGDVAELLREVLFTQGEPSTAVARGVVFLTSDTGGQDALTFVDAQGDPIADAHVFVYLTSHYEDPPEDGLVPVAVTSTDALGRMRDAVALMSGYSYTVYWTKPWYEGPVTHEIDL